MNRKNKKPWPTEAAMEQIYKMKLWGTNNDSFYSGFGSHDTKIVTPYLEVVKSFLSSFEEPLVVCDLGCGDFNVGKELVKYTKKYIAVDIVSDLITYNRERFKQENLEFYCLDITVDNLPVGDCVLVRQVLQHLSNEEVKNVVSKLSEFKYIVLTEHLPNGNFEANKDIISGQGIRLKKKSGVNLLLPPFHLKVKQEKELLSILLEGNKGRVVTTIYQVY